jgi:hypothetical protein
VCDSKAALSNVKESTDKERPPCQQPNHADYLGIIQGTTKLMDHQVVPVWVKGHQTKPTRNTEVSSQSDINHNNYVDKKATWYREDSHKSPSKNTSEHTSESIVSVFLNKTRLVSHIEDSIRYHTNGYHLRQYTQVKHGWSDATWACFDVESFGMFYKRLASKDQTYQTKYMFDQLSVGVNRYKRARIKTEELKQCPCCRVSTESTDHVILCKRNPARKESIAALKKGLQGCDNHPTLRLLSAGLCHWVETPDIPFQPDVKGYPPKFAEPIKCAIQEQHDLGWSQAMRGYLSIHWRLMASDGIYDTDQTEEGRGRQTIRQFYTEHFKFTHSLWQARNKVLHDDHSPELRAIRDQELAELKALYTNQDKIGAGDRHYCAQPIEAILRKNPSSRRRWMRYMYRARKRYELAIQHQPLITNFFRRRE